MCDDALTYLEQLYASMRLGSKAIIAETPGSHNLHEKDIAGDVPSDASWTPRR
jgi:hypothetical protein